MAPSKRSLSTLSLLLGILLVGFSCDGTPLAEDEDESLKVRLKASVSIDAMSGFGTFRMMRDLGLPVRTTQAFLDVPGNAAKLDRIVRFSFVRMPAEYALSWMLFIADAEVSVEEDWLTVQEKPGGADGRRLKTLYQTGGPAEVEMQKQLDGEVKHIFRDVGFLEDLGLFLACHGLSVIISPEIEITEKHETMDLPIHPDIPAHKKVTVRKALEYILSETGWNYKVQGRAVFIIPTERGDNPGAGDDK